ncbi:MAG: SPFH domain-containing protein [Planctomycetota bacterium]|jgi:regulator of protease activity HflC (stomatin/prohibitin superfamily)
MATITKFPGIRHLRSEPSVHVLQFRRGDLVRSGRGLAFWFLPLSTTLAEIPCDDRDETFLFHGRSHDYQDVTAQGVITYRVTDPETLAKRVDFSLDPSTGAYRQTPLEQLSQLLIQAAQQHAWDYLSGTPVRELLADGVEQIRERITAGLTEDFTLKSMGLEVVSVRVQRVAPTAELEKALQAPTTESIQQQADEAIFQRRALAVEKERAIQENELQNQIELSKREEELIAQQGANERNRATEQAEAQRIASDAKAERQRTEASARADSIVKVEEAKVGAERDRMDIFRDLPAHVLMGLAAQELARKLEKIEHLNISPEMLGPILQRLMAAGTQHLENGAHAEAERN